MNSKILTLLAFVLLPLCSFAQTVNVDARSLMRRLDSIDRRLMALEEKIFTSTATEAGKQSLGDLELRVQEMESESTNLYGAVEKLGNAVDKLGKRMESINQDMDFRLQDLENRKPQVAVPTSTNNAPAPSSSASTQLKATTEKQEPKAIEMPEKFTVPEGLSAEEHYKKAYSFLTSAQYPTAQKWLEEFLVRHPKHALADNSYYWLGEVFLIQNKPEQAIIAFKNGLTNFPKGAKAAGNLLKMGEAFKILKQNTHAKSAWNKLIKDYPKSPEASKAKLRLEKLGA